ncbi:SLC5 family protein [Leptospira kmetyi]|uniref:SLC5 family protein n=1 Tax=Leptospira kmetyi TaxID=408139 RepID=UPI0010830E9D|nr:sodium/solute symporter [Leptospira kmetyi]TGK17674.1 transporter [Leptospira kmetyi]TGK25066.1 transporter [Leptospira kmetyi]TGL71093.1 transporter [Leptospira kmetyi]
MFTLIDALFFLITILLVLGIGIYAGRKEETGEDYFLGGRSLPWWGVAGSLFGTNVSANHIVGMLGIGYSVGFAQSHYMFGAIPALLLLGYVLLPIYRRKRIFTLSQFLEYRYGPNSRLLYSGIVLVLISIQLAAGLYIGSRSLLPFFRDLGWPIGYVEGVLLLAIVSTVYTWFGGLKAVVYTDVIQSVFILLAGLILAYLTLNHPAVGGWEGLLQKEAILSPTDRRMTFFLPSDHTSLPWTGALGGLFLLHAFYWGTNQYVVQRTLGASSLRSARAGILGDGFLTLTIPFFTVLTGVAAYHLFRNLGESNPIDPDEAFSKLVAFVIPGGYGFGGIVLAGLLGAIFSSVDSMLNSASTLFTIDYYSKFRKTEYAKRFFSTSEMQEAESVSVGRAFLLLFSAFTVFLALVAYDPSSKGNFFLELSAQSSHLTPGLLVVFLTGILWKKANSLSATWTILICPFVSWALPYGYEFWIGIHPQTISIFGAKLNFLHRVFLVFLFGLIFHITLSRRFFSEGEWNRKTLNVRVRVFWKTKLRIAIGILWILFCVALSYYDVTDNVTGAAFCGGGTFLSFLTVSIAKTLRFPASKRIKAFFKTDEWAFGLLLGITIGLYFYFS